jgi:3-oxoadipate enol-lactonase
MAALTVRALQVRRPFGTLSVALAGAEGGEAPPVLLLASLGADHRMWAPQVAALAGDRRLIVPDPRGHGASDAGTTPITLAELIEDVVAVLDAARVARADVIGLSLGGMTGMGLALAHPERVRSLVGACTRADAPAPFAEAWIARAEAVLEHGLGPIWGPTSERWLNSEWRAANPATLAELRAMFLATDPAAYAGVARALSGLDLLGRLPGLRPPALFLSGSEDRGIPTEVVAALAAAVPGARHLALPGAAHLANIDSADAFTAALKGWLHEQDATDAHKGRSPRGGRP